MLSGAEASEGTRETKVEIKKLGEIAEITRGGNFQKKDFVENGLPCIHYGQMYTHFGTWTDKTLTFVSKDIFEKSKKAQPNDIVMAVTSENVEDVCKCTAWVGNKPIAVSGHTAIIHHNQNAKYLSYYFQSELFYRQKVKLAHGTKVIEVTPDKLKEITIPLPPLSVQQRIVNVLDNFDTICSDLKIGLPAEIEARKKQYEYYRDLLLSFNENVNNSLHGGGNHQDEIKLLQYVFGYAVVRLGDVATLTRGVRVTRNMLDNEERIPVYQNALIPLGYFNKSNRKRNTAFVISAGAAGQIGYSAIDFWAADDCFTFDDLKGVLSKYIFYFLQTKQSFIDSRVRRGSVPRISRKIFEDITIPLPPLSVQQRIVKILDRFDSLCNDISSGIPAEIEARKKQYEYYRDKLLTFYKK